MADRREDQLDRLERVLIASYHLRPPAVVSPGVLDAVMRVVRQEAPWPSGWQLFMPYAGVIWRTATITAAAAAVAAVVVIGTGGTSGADRTGMVEDAEFAPLFGE